jgi:hypothetical protein
MGHAAEARRLLAQLNAEAARRYVSPVLPAFVHAALGESDAAFALLEKAFAAKDPLLIPIQVWEAAAAIYLPGERAATLRADPRYGDLVRRMRLPGPRLLP